ncbi:MAG: flavin-nucleotide-binding protein [Actinomycetia bacterium]|nr:flavin-nucleotide-binding protein [Actinomycetes bacterium]
MSDRTQVRRKPERASYERAELDAILDEAKWCHLGLVRDGQPVVLPTIHGRLGDIVYLHGSPAAGFVRQAGAPVCVSVTLVDALVLARAVRNHSMNYRSAVLFGTARLVTDDAEKLAALEAVTEHVAPGRWSGARPPTEKELQGTAVLALPIDEFSVKRRTGPPLDDGEGEFPAWAGLVPVTTVLGTPEPAPFSPPGCAPPRW